MSSKKQGMEPHQGGPGSSHRNAKKPMDDTRHGPEPANKRTETRSNVSGGGGNYDSHHTHDPRTKG